MEEAGRIELKSIMSLPKAMRGMARMAREIPFKGTPENMDRVCLHLNTLASRTALYAVTAQQGNFVTAYEACWIVTTVYDVYDSAVALADAMSVGWDLVNLGAKLYNYSVMLNRVAARIKMVHRARAIRMVDEAKKDFITFDSHWDEMD
jgi:hypothetical protein